MDGRVGLTDLLHEINYLASLAAALKDGNIPWKNDDNCKHHAFIIDQVKTLILEIRRNMTDKAVNPLDFTDQLWDCLKTSQSIETLRQSFQLVYNELQVFIVLIMLF